MPINFEISALAQDFMWIFDFKCVENIKIDFH
uniref:Uncharacterized protein n=1 Tax=viral metagenome TaxID=1070528 RepID=A0A6C0BLF9_9ZZZZ